MALLRIPLQQYHEHSILVLVIVLIGAVTAVIAAPVTTISHAEHFFTQFEYFNFSHWNSSSKKLLPQNTWEKVVMKFRRFPEKLDGEMIPTMLMSCCSVRDMVGLDSNTRSKRYALHGSYWKSKDLTYRISKYSKQLDQSTVDKEIARAFGVWSEHTDLTFTSMKTGAVDIEIKFVENEHGDQHPFDGAKGVLSHAYFPEDGGDVHFDDAEQWTSNTSQGTNLFQVAVHEFGHALGLEHSDVRASAMARFYKFNPKFRLDPDDVKGIQALYGPKTSSLCKSPKFDAIFNDNDGNSYFFKGDKYYQIIRNNVTKRFPKRISVGWPGLPGSIDAAYTYKNGKTYFFKGTKYWQYRERQMESGYPREISEDFPGLPDNIDAALVWNNATFFFKGSKYWKYDPQQNPSVDSVYPKLISNWIGLPNGVDAAMEYTDGFYYFFKDDKYYRYDAHLLAINQGLKSLPRLTSKWWFGC